MDISRLPERVTSKIKFTDSCWLWQNAKTNGYGVVWSTPEKRVVRAHRLVYETLVGPIEPGLHLDHLCRVPSCVNPEHLEPVTPRENIFRGVSPVIAKAAQTHCKRGHPLSGDNLLINRSRNTRMCRQCMNETSRRRRMGSAGVCLRDGCDKFVNSKNMCSNHYAKWVRDGRDPNDLPVVLSQ